MVMGWEIKSTGRTHMRCQFNYVPSVGEITKGFEFGIYWVCVSPLDDQGYVRVEQHYSCKFDPIQMGC